jgi:hypothetical protein
MLYVGAGDQVFVRTAAAPSPLRASATYPGAGTTREVSSIAINPTNPQNAFAVDSTNVYRTTNAGGSWTNITGNLLALVPGTLRSMAFSTSNAGGSLIVGSDNGVFIAPGPAFNTWTVLGTGLPRAPVYDLDYDRADQLVVAGLLGRGAWTLSFQAPPPGPGVAGAIDAGLDLRCEDLPECQISRKLLPTISFKLHLIRTYRFLGRREVQCF